MDIEHLAVRVRVDVLQVVEARWSCGVSSTWATLSPPHWRRTIGSGPMSEGSTPM